MEGKQLSLFSPTEKQHPSKKQKKAKLGRYEKLQKELANNESDRYKTFLDINSPPLTNCHYNFMDLFCGAGGMTLGLKNAGFNPVASVEISPIASETHRKNFPQCHHFNGEIQDFKPREWLEAIASPEIHLIAGGPPCQGFSVAGKRNPNDPRNSLFREFIRVVSEIRPWYIVMENVPGILTMKKGLVKDEICQAFVDIGYHNVSIAILESAAYRVPQIRPRAIFIANRFGMENPYPKPQLLPHQYQSIESAISDLPEYTPIPEINHQWTRHSAAYMERIAKVPPGGSLYETYVDAFKRQYPGKPSMTVKENHGGTHIHPHLNRVISAREMARLQSFPDTFIFEGSMKKAMWQIGNAVPPRLAECIGYALIPYLSKISQKPRFLASEKPGFLNNTFAIFGAMLHAACASPTRFWPHVKPGICEKPGFLGVRVDRVSVLTEEKKPGWQKTGFLGSIPSPFFCRLGGVKGTRGNTGRGDTVTSHLRVWWVWCLWCVLLFKVFLFWRRCCSKNRVS